MIKSNEKVAIFGATGSIGVQALDVIERMGKFKVASLTADNNWQRLAEFARKFKPQSVVIANEDYYGELKQELSGSGVEILCGQDSLAEIAIKGNYDVCINGLVGTAGLLPSYHCLKNEKRLLLANKESLVIGGEFLCKLLKKTDNHIIPIDSEHSAIMQCLYGEDMQYVSKLILTASGGPFREWTLKAIENATPQDALKHPTWKMGNRITIDSATLMNKGFEIIEACYLFDIPIGSIEAVIHPQSIIHSMVEFVDGSFKAQLGKPDMRLPIQLSLSYPDRFPLRSFVDNPIDWKQLNFEAIDEQKFPCLNLAKRAFSLGGTAGAILNAVDEVAIDAFLKGKLGFMDISKLIDEALNSIEIESADSIEILLTADTNARKFASNLIEAKFHNH